MIRPSAETSAAAGVTPLDKSKVAVLARRTDDGIGTQRDGTARPGTKPTTIDTDLDAGLSEASKVAAAGSAAAAASADVECQADGDCCPEDPDKTEPGRCGCGQSEGDYDSDTLIDCEDPAPRGWLRRLLLDGSQVEGELEGFPVLIRITDAHLGVFAAEDGTDIHFVAADGGTLLDHEVEQFDAARGELTAWVRLPSLASASDAVLYLAYGDGHTHSAGTSALWIDHQYVWHMTDDLAASEARIVDSTGRAHATATGGMTTENTILGVAGQGLEFDGRDDQLVFENDLEGDTPSTFEAWVFQYPPLPTSNGSAVIALGDQATNRARFLMSVSNNRNTVQYGFYENDRGGALIATEVWRHLAWIWDGSLSSLFINGELVEGPTPHYGADTRGTSGRIGNTNFDAPRYDYFLAGALDEVRVSAVARSSAWIATEYANQRPDSTFIKSIDAPEPAL